MRKIPLVVAGLLALTAAVPGASLAQSGMVDGEVRKIDPAQNKITLRHGPLKKLDMDEPMTMVFRVKDPAMLKTVKVGDKVKFEADRVNGQLTVTRMQKTK